MAGDAKPNLKYLRVDNWAVFFLQRLQLLFAKGDCCDLTLKFVSGQELKVHRLVLSTSTSFFESMESNGNVIELPHNLPYNVVQPIINFLYSGRLEFKAELYPELLSIAKIMKLAILARLLAAQKKDNSDQATGQLVGIKKIVKSPSKKSLHQPSSYVNIVAGKKLPIWKKRMVPYKIERKPLKEEEPKPTRFEWPDEETCNNMIMTSPSFTSLSYESAPVISPAAAPPSSTSPQSLPSTSLKRRVMPPINNVPDKIFKADGNAITNNVTNIVNADSQQSNDPSVSDDDDDDGHFETIHTYGDSDDETDAPIEPETPVGHLKPILKPMSETPLSTPSKRVRFSFAPEDKENKNEKATENVETPKAKVPEKTDIPKSTEKIIQEVLKKYPDLVKNNKNIKLKITSPGSPYKQNTITIDPKKRFVQSKSSYIVLKPAVKPDVTSTPENLDKSAKKSPPTIEETKGNWKCETCISGNETLKFNSQSEYKKHLQEKHSEKIDSRICGFCGYKASKRNLHLYHLFTKHGVDPPKNVKFPKCGQCSYIALSDSLLIKHVNSHQIARDLTCEVCNTTFKTYSSLHVHSLSCKTNIGVRSYPCMNCKKVFKTTVSLNAHLKVCTAGNEENDEGGGEEEQTRNIQSIDNVIEVPIIEAVDMDKGEHALVPIPSGIILAETPNVALLPSSESEGLTNVASSIATSIGLAVALPQEQQQTVILLDSNSEIFLQENAVVVSDKNDLEEYIVPELLRDEMGQIYTTQNVPYTVSSTGVISCPIMSIQSTNDGKDNNEHFTITEITNEQNNVEGELKDLTELNDHSSLLHSAETHLESSNTRVEIKDSQAEDLELLRLQKSLQSPEPPDLPENTILNEGDKLLEVQDNLRVVENNLDIIEPNTAALPTTELTANNDSEIGGIRVIDDDNEQVNDFIMKEPMNDKNENEPLNDKDEDKLIHGKNEDDLLHDKNEDEIIHDKNEDDLIHDKNEDELIHDKNEHEILHDSNDDELINVNNEDQLISDKDREETIEEDQQVSDQSMCEEPEESIGKNDTDKANSLVRDWGFDNDEETEEDIDDPESRPSRPTLEF